MCMVILYRHNFMKFVENCYWEYKILSVSPSSANLVIIICILDPLAWPSSVYCPNATSIAQYFNILPRISGADPKYRWRRREKDKCGGKKWEMNFVCSHFLCQLLPPGLKLGEKLPRLSGPHRCYCWKA